MKNNRCGATEGLSFYVNHSYLAAPVLEMVNVNGTFCSSAILYPGGIRNSAGSGSARLIFITALMNSPVRGSMFFDKTVSPISGEVQISVVATIGRSLPTAPTA
jgi:hypothetical protein